MEHLSHTPPLRQTTSLTWKDLTHGKVLGLPTNILGWKGLPGTNTQALYDYSYITDIISFITLAPGADLIKHFKLATAGLW